MTDDIRIGFHPMGCSCATCDREANDRAKAGRALADELERAMTTPPQPPPDTQVAPAPAKDTPAPESSGAARCPDCGRGMATITEVGTTRCWWRLSGEHRDQVNCLRIALANTRAELAREKSGHDQAHNEASRLHTECAKAWSEVAREKDCGSVCGTVGSQCQKCLREMFHRAVAETASEKERSDDLRGGLAVYSHHMPSCARVVDAASCSCGLSPLLDAREGEPEYPGSINLRGALAREQERADAAEARLPDGMKECTILFMECELGHGWLTATNWIEHGCPTCALAAEQAAHAVTREARTLAARLHSEEGARAAILAGQLADEQAAHAETRKRLPPQPPDQDPRHGK